MLINFRRELRSRPQLQVIQIYKIPPPVKLTAAIYGNGNIVENGTKNHKLTNQQNTLNWHKGNNQTKTVYSNYVGKYVQCGMLGYVTRQDKDSDQI